MKATESFCLAYIECALWSSTDPETEQPLDSDAFRLPEKTEKKLRAQCDAFFDYVESLNDATLLAYIIDEDSQSGHDFWLTRNGHGAGFWDRGLGELGDKLTEASKTFGEVYLYTNRNWIYVY